jgi:O-antigen/teichoic acid export membrane protein
MQASSGRGCQERLAHDQDRWSFRAGKSPETAVCMSARFINFIPARLWRRCSGLLPRGRLTHAITMLLSGTAFAQALTVVAAPVLTRLYTPEDFGTLAVFTTLFGVTCAVVCLQYNASIPVAEEDVVAANLLAVVASVGLLTSAVAAVIIAVIGEQTLARLVNTPALAPLLWLLPLGLLLVGLHNGLNFWAVRRRSFARIAHTRIAQGCAQVVVQIALGVLALAPIGLVLGQIAGQSAGISTFARGLWREDRDVLRMIAVRRMIRAAYRYRRFPLLACPAAVLNGISRLSPPMLVAILYGPATAGWFALAHRVLTTPMRLLGQAVAQVYLGEAPALARDDPARLRQLFTRMTARLFWLGFGPAALILLAGPWLASIVFGPPWADAGRIMQALTLMTFAQFVVSPISQTLIVFERHDVQIAWDGARVAGIVLTFVSAWLLQWSWLVTSIVFSALMATAYAALYVIARRLITARIGVADPLG